MSSTSSTINKQRALDKRNSSANGASRGAAKCASIHTLKELGKELDRPLYTLEVLANDPFTADREARKRGAEWFAELWGRLGRAGLHVHGFHYILVSQETPVLMPEDGKPYENTMYCEARLTRHALDARYLELVSADDITDRRNEEVLINDDRESVDAEIGVGERTDTVEFPPLEIPELICAAPVIKQRYLVEVWIEKSTMDDVLKPLCQRHEVNLQRGIGEISHTRCAELVNRVAADGRPARIIYISDFDPAGKSMPVAAARKIEFALRSSGRDLDIQLRPIVLTHEQCIEYQLPRTPLKDTERRAATFEARFGAGATELDALEALRPGILEQVVEQEIERYRDGDLPDRIDEMVKRVDEELAEINTEVQERHAAAIAALQTERESAVAAWKAYEAKARKILNKIENDLTVPDVDDYDWPEPGDGDEDDDPLFDSSRDYVEQVDRFKEHQGKPTTGIGYSGPRRGKEHTAICPMCQKPFVTRRKDTKTCSSSACKYKWRMREQS